MKKQRRLKVSTSRKRERTAVRIVARVGDGRAISGTEGPYGTQVTAAFRVGFGAWVSGPEQALTSRLILIRD